jgi:hypothetical protein
VEEIIKVNPSFKVLIANGLVTGHSGADVALAVERGFINKPFELNKPLAMARKTIDED